jgi:hypothetical protein
MLHRREGMRGAETALSWPTRSLVTAGDSADRGSRGFPLPCMGPMLPSCVMATPPTPGTRDHFPAPINKGCSSRQIRLILTWLGAEAMARPGSGRSIDSRKRRATHRPWVPFSTTPGGVGGKPLCGLADSQASILTLLWYYPTSQWENGAECGITGLSFRLSLPLLHRLDNAIALQSVTILAHKVNYHTYIFLSRQMIHFKLSCPLTIFILRISLPHIFTLWSWKIPGGFSSLFWTDNP